MDIDRVSKYADVLRSFIVTISILGGAVWAVVQFGATKEADLAAAGLAKVKTELHTMERQLRGDANLDIAVTAMQACSDDQNRYFIDASVVISNRGSRSALLDLSSSKTSGFFAVNISIQPNGTTIFKGAYSADPFLFNPGRPSDPEMLGIHDIQPKVTKNLRYWIPVPSSGLYLVFFVSPMSKSDREVAQERLKREGSPLIPVSYRWSARDYIVVQEEFCSKSIIKSE